DRSEKPTVLQSWSTNGRHVSRRCQSDGCPLLGTRDKHPIVQQLVALLHPNAAASREHPCGSGVAVVCGATLNRRVSVARKSNRKTLLRAADRPHSHELRSLLRPGGAAACEHPHRAGLSVVVRSANKSRVAGECG